MKAFEKAKWIWVDNLAEENEYGEFFAALYTERICDTKLRISCDGDYALWINERFVACNQYGDFEHYKIYDEIEVTDFLSVGKNTVKVLCWHFGADTQRYKKAAAGVIFEAVQAGELLLKSDETVLCGKSKSYQNGKMQTITPQIGYSFAYDATKENERELVSATPVFKNCVFYPRPTARLSLGERARVDALVNEGTHYLFDLGEEMVGLATLDFFSQTEQNLVVAWGEHLEDGKVRRIIGNRDFSFRYRAKTGRNIYTNYFLRLGCRYIEVFCEKPISVNYIGLLPQSYPTLCKEPPKLYGLDKKIYDTCVKTLRLCMMEHYVDTPWREQCLYAFDSRNQILCGYYAFEKGNAEYARANLKLMGEDRREDGLLSITYPCGIDLTIPSFSLYYFLALKEYLQYTGDRSLIDEVLPKLLSIAEVFLAHRKDGLICKFEGANHWNFYDWSENLEGKLYGTEEAVADLVINCLFLTALDCLKKFGVDYGEIAAQMKEKLREKFFDNEAGMYEMTVGGKQFTTLGNALAILSGVATEKQAKQIAEKIVLQESSDCSLSMKSFKYDALLKADRERYTPYILSEIRREYGLMLEKGATSVWETIDGAAAFENAGSLCHGWSALPVYYYHIL